MSFRFVDEFVGETNKNYKIIFTHCKSVMMAIKFALGVELMLLTNGQYLSQRLLSNFFKTIVEIPLTNSITDQPISLCTPRICENASDCNFSSSIFIECSWLNYRTRVPGFSNCSLASLKKTNDKCLFNVPTYQVFHILIYILPNRKCKIRNQPSENCERLAPKFYSTLLDILPTIGTIK